MPSIYILLTKSTTSVSRAINLVTGAEYTHTSISIDNELNCFYSFSRKKKFLFPAGFVSEDIESGYYQRHSNIPCALYELSVSDKVYSEIKNKLMEMRENADYYRYNVVGLFLCYASISYDRPYHYFCSQFVGSLLENSGAISFLKPVSALHPDDFTGMAQLKLLYKGKLKGLISYKKKMMKKETSSMPLPIFAYAANES